MSNVAEISDRVFLRQMSFHTSGPTYAEELAEQRKRNEWVDNRTRDIYLSKHYRLDLVAYVLEGKRADAVFDGLFEATSANYIDALSVFHAELLKEARGIAESEAQVRFGF